MNSIGQGMFGFLVRDVELKPSTLTLKMNKRFVEPNFFEKLFAHKVSRFVTKYTYINISSI